MMASLSTLVVVVLAAGPTNDIGIGVSSERSIERAELDFDARRAELGLIGSAPMDGLERSSHESGSALAEPLARTSSARRHTR